MSKIELFQHLEGLTEALGQIRNGTFKPQIPPQAIVRESPHRGEPIKSRPAIKSSGEEEEDNYYSGGFWELGGNCAFEFPAIER